MNIVRSNGNLYTLIGSSWTSSVALPITGAQAIAGVVYSNQVQLYYLDGSGSLKYCTGTQGSGWMVWSSVSSLAANVQSGSPLAATWNHETGSNVESVSDDLTSLVCFLTLLTSSRLGGYSMYSTHWQESRTIKTSKAVETRTASPSGSWG